jgi:hypothetical protein
MSSACLRQLDCCRQDHLEGDGIYVNGALKNERGLLKALLGMKDKEGEKERRRVQMFAL